MKWRYNLVSPVVKGYKDSEIGYLYGCSDNWKKSNGTDLMTIAGFDMDPTLIRPASWKRFPKDADDWEWAYPNVKSKLRSLHKKGYEIIIVTNQGGIKSSIPKLEEFKQKLENIERDICEDYPNISFRIYCLNNKDVHRKPYPTILMNHKIDRAKSFYCGDAAGRQNDHSGSDIKFAYNLRLRFMTPEKLFAGDADSQGIIEYPISPYNQEILKRREYQYVQNSQAMQELIIMVGLPGSGKSHITDMIMRYYKSINQPIDYISLDILRSKPKMFR